MDTIESLRPDDTIWLGEYFIVLRRRKWSVIVVTLVAVLAALLYARQQTPIYESSARVNATTVFQAQGQGVTAPQMETEQAFVTSDLVTKCAQLIVEDAGFRSDPSSQPDLVTICSAPALEGIELDRSLQHSLHVTSTQSSTVMAIAFNSASRRSAQIYAQAFGLAYIYERTAQAQSQLDQLRAPLLDDQDHLSEQISTYNQRIGGATADAITAANNGEQPTVILAINQKIQDLSAKRDAAQQQLNNITLALQNLDPSRLNPPQLMLPAGLPIDPVSPNVPVIGLFGLLIGLAVGVALALLRERLDDGLRGRADLERNLGVPVLAVIPRVPGWRNKQEARLIAREQPKSAVAEAYRTLRTSISFISAQRRLKVLMVCSPGAGEGKTMTAANLALVLADAGRRVVLVSADLRKPRLHRFFNLPNNIGLSSVLANEAQPWEAILDPGVENLKVLPSGPVPGRPAELLQSEQMGEVLAGLREVADFVVIDTAPLLLVADALALAPLADGMLFVADADRTSRGAVAHSREQLEQVGATLIGSILNNFDPAKATAYRYYGGYYGAYRYGYGGRYGQYGGDTHELNENGRVGREQPVLEIPRDQR